MKTLAISLVVMGAAMLTSAAADAGHHRHVHHRHHHNQHHQSFRHHNHGYKFNYVNHYRSLHHNWSYSNYSPKYGCTIYHCPTTHADYYWSAAYSCYFPVSYCPTGSYCN